MKETKPVSKPDFVIKDIGGETMLYSATDEMVHILNPTAHLIWELCDGEHTLADIEKVIRAKFSVPQAHNVEQDIRHTLDSFAQKGLLQ